MFKKPVLKILIPVLIFTLGLFLFLIPKYLNNNWLNNSSPELTSYTNPTFNFSLTYPSAWHFKASNDSAFSLIKNKFDFTPDHKGPLYDVQIAVFSYNLISLSHNDHSFPQIDQIQDWIDWQNNRPESPDTEILGIPEITSITVASQPAIKQTYLQPPYQEHIGKFIRVSVLSPDKKSVTILQYVGVEPYFTDNLSTFNQLLSSFQFN